MSDLNIYEPQFKDLWFKDKMLSDDETMAYNAKWGGAIGFPVDRRYEWYKLWVENADGNRFYRYLVNEDGEFVGEIAYRYDEVRDIYLSDIIIFAPYRMKGYGKRGLGILCEQAKSRGITSLSDDIAVDNLPAIRLFLSCGFTEYAVTDEIVTVKKDL